MWHETSQTRGHTEAYIRVKPCAYPESIWHLPPACDRNENHSIQHQPLQSSAPRGGLPCLHAPIWLSAVLHAEGLQDSLADAWRFVLSLEPSKIAALRLSAETLKKEGLVLVVGPTGCSSHFQVFSSFLALVWPLWLVYLYKYILVNMALQKAIWRLPSEFRHVQQKLPKDSLTASR